ncbi:MAG TPA: uroporphyrinogen decarboxylase family protein, partial [Spirochaetia bacterium]|nr:uroporphyrinogen decarboxylase family protein [Spirochaetia bacterium]
HDDFVWTAGAFMNPEIYRNVIIPRFAELWKPIHRAGKKVLFCSDGNFMEFAQDIVEAGADGLIFEPCNDFGFMVERFGNSQCLVGSCVDCRDLTFNRWSKVEADIDRTFALLERCRGAIVAVGNHLPANIPDDVMTRYLAEVRARVRR